MIINTNISSLNSQRQVQNSVRELQQSTERLSSGKRINKAADDAAGMAISDRMTAQIRGMNQARRNANDIISMVQTAEGSLIQIQENLQRIRELAVEGANATQTDDDRVIINKEVKQLVSEIKRIADTAEFNGRKLFTPQGYKSDAVSDSSIEFYVKGLSSGWLRSAEKRVEQFYGLKSDGADLAVAFKTRLEKGEQPSAELAHVAGLAERGKPGQVFGQVLVIDTTAMPATPTVGNTNPWGFANADDKFTGMSRVLAHEMTHAIMGRSIDIVTASDWFVEGTAEFMHGADERVKAEIGDSVTEANIKSKLFDSQLEKGKGKVTTSKQYAQSYLATRYLHHSLKARGGIKGFMEYLNANKSVAFTNSFEKFVGMSEDDFLKQFKNEGHKFEEYGINLDNEDTGAIGGLDADGGLSLDYKSVANPFSGERKEQPLKGFNLIWSPSDATLKKTLGLDQNYERDAYQVWGYKDVFDGSSATVSYFMQVGPNHGDSLRVEMPTINLSSLQLSDINIAFSQESASMAIDIVDYALGIIDDRRAELGAIQNRTIGIINNLRIAAENISAARSRIQDTDYAQETSSLTRASIIQQASTAMLAQANQRHQVVLQLLRS